VVFKDLSRPQRRFRLAVINAAIAQGVALLRDNTGAYHRVSHGDLADPIKFRVVRA
jgi:hypothetical protein